MAELITKMRQIKFKDIIYPVVTVSGALIFLIVFVLSIRFLLVSINNVFVESSDEGIVRFDIETFKKISRRLGI